MADHTGRMDAKWPVAQALRHHILRPLICTLYQHSRHCLNGETEKDHRLSIEQHLDKHIGFCDVSLRRLQGFRDTGMLDQMCEALVRRLEVMLRSWSNESSAHRGRLKSARDVESASAAREVLENVKKTVNAQVLPGLRQIHVELRALDPDFRAAGDVLSAGSSGNGVPNDGDNDGKVHGGSATTVHPNRNSEEALDGNDTI